MSRLVFSVEGVDELQQLKESFGLFEAILDKNGSWVSVGPPPHAIKLAR
jgi:hypothetical protein